MENNDILTGDKFGDVYSMPLIPSAEPRAVSKTRNQMGSMRIAATNLTVHTQRNLRSLEMQLERQNDSNQKKESEKPIFDHDLLLGHVSLLTDVAFASFPSPDPSSTQKRSYILSADRDEHIRVSRSAPQAHVIENYCLGHTSFISKLCIPQWAPEFLISGGGDPHLMVWNWAAGELLHTVPLVEESLEGKEVAVRGIWAASLGPEAQRVIFVSLEGCVPRSSSLQFKQTNNPHRNPTLQTFTLETNGSITPQDPVQASGNVLDVQVSEDANTVLISVDCIREPGSTQEWRSSPVPSASLLEAFRLKQGSRNKLEWESVSDAVINTINEAGTSPVSLPADGDHKQKAALNNSLYTMTNLRKKLGEDYDER